MKQCMRCQGYLTSAVLEERSGRMLAVIPCIRCVNCGDYVDEIIVRHRGRARRPWAWTLAS